MVLESDFTKRGGGGAESQLRTVAHHLRRRGHVASVVTPLLVNSPPATAERCFGIPVGRIRYPRIPTVGAALMSLRLALFLIGHGRRYDAWHVHIGHHLGAVTCLVGALLGKPVVVKISGSWEFERGVLARDNPKPLDWLARRWLRQASAVQAISTRIAREMARHGFPPERILVLPNAVDTARFQVRATTRSPGTPFRAVFVGRLVAEKGLDTLLDAWARAFGRRSDVDVRLELVGGGPLEDQLRTQVAALGIAGQVAFLGHHDRVEEVLAHADVGLLPSRFEGLSNTLLEYMASGIPPLASRVGGSEDFVLPGVNGWLFPVDDVEALAAALLEAEALPPERLAVMGRQARADVETGASLERVIGRLTELYRGTHPRELGQAG
jgi:glycosyltransferase involved in cell wall biosynthesis